MKKLILFVLVLFNVGFAFSQAVEFDWDYSKTPVCPGDEIYYLVAQKYISNGRIIEWDIKNGRIIRNYGYGVEIAWNNVAMTNGSMPMGELGFWHNGIRYFLPITIISVNGLMPSIVLNGNNNPTSINIPYDQTAQYPITVRANPQNYPNTSMPITNFEWTLSSGLSSSLSGNRSGANQEISISVDKCATSPQKIQVRGVNNYCNGELSPAREVSVAISISDPTPITTNVSSSSIQYGTRTSVSCTTTCSIKPDHYEWVISGGFEGSEIRTTPGSTPTLTLTHNGCEDGTVSVRAVYCGGKKSNLVSKTISVVGKPGSNMMIYGASNLPDPINSVYGIYNLISGASVSWEWGEYLEACSSGVNGPTMCLRSNLPSTLDCASSYVRATISKGNCSITRSSTVRVGTSPKSGNISTTLNSKGVPFPSNAGGTLPPHGIICAFIDNATYNRMEVPSYTSSPYPSLSYPSEIIKVEWQPTSDFRPEVSLVYGIGQNPPSGTNSSQLLRVDVTPTPNPYATAHINVRLQNDCGWSSWKTIEYKKGSTCGSSIFFSYSPNPTSDELTVNFEQLPTMENSGELSETTSNKPTTSNKVATYSVKLLDASGMVLRQTQFTHRYGDGKPQPVKFNLSSLRKGTYFLHVEGGGELMREQIVVSK